MLGFLIAPNFVVRGIYYLRKGILIIPFDNKIMATRINTYAKQTPLHGHIETFKQFTQLYFILIYFIHPTAWMC